MDLGTCLELKFIKQTEFPYMEGQANDRIGK